MFDESDTDSDESSILDNDFNLSDTDSENSEFDSDSDGEFGNDEDEDGEFDGRFADIYQADSYHVYSEKTDGHYYIGTAKRIVPGLLLMVNSVSVQTFYWFSFDRIREYLSKYSVIHMPNAKVHIMKLCILEDETYSVVLKTHWLRLVQRHWKKVYRERKQKILSRCSLKNQIYRQLHGKYPDGLNAMPSIYGMMNCYSCNCIS
uniref:Uncharacterized protein n=1 Tax=viral metagenome TaxID=1070528 RepID=A0A6C0JEI4_9ZZZZ